MFKLYSILALLKKGTSLRTACRAVRHIKLSETEVLFLRVFAALLLGYWLGIYLITHADEYQFKYSTRDQVATLYQSKTLKYEQVILSCLNGHGVVINGRNMDCIIKNYKGAL